MSPSNHQYLPAQPSPATHNNTPLPAMRPYDQSTSQNTDPPPASSGGPATGSAFPPLNSYASPSSSRKNFSEPNRSQWPPPSMPPLPFSGIGSGFPPLGRPLANGPTTPNGASRPTPKPEISSGDMVAPQPPRQNQSTSFQPNSEQPPLHTDASQPTGSYPLNPAQATNASAADRIRLRVNKACERCRSHKIKCSGSHPCTNCSKHNVQCTFRTSTVYPRQNEPVSMSPTNSIASDGPPQKKPRVFGEDVPYQYQPVNGAGSNPITYTSHALPVVNKSRSDPSYTAYLENRVHYLESLLSSSHSSNIKNVRDIDPDSDTLIELLRHSSSKWRASARPQNVLIIDLCKSLYSGLPQEYKEQVKLPRAQFFGWNLSGCNYLKPDPLPQMVDISELSEESRAYYLDFFFQEINPLYAILHESVFREQVSAYVKQTKSSSAQTNVTALFSAMLCLVYVLSIRFTEFMNPRGPSMELLQLEEKLFKYSHHVIQLFSFEYESFELIQCWLLVALYLRIAHRQTSCTAALSRAVSMCRSMGLMRNISAIAKVSKYDLLKAKRIFFAVYSFDRLIGLLGGTPRGINHDDITREFPGFDYEYESREDEWITLPSFAMLRIAMVANFLRADTADNYDLLKAQQINKEITVLQNWLNENGFDDVHDIFPGDGSGRENSNLVKAVVKLHFYDMILNIHGKLLFGYVGKRVVSEGMHVEKVMEANEGVIYLLKKIEANNCLYAPWYVNLLLSFTVGVNCLVFINASIFLKQSRRLMKDSMALLQKFQASPVRDENDRFIFKDRFKMVGECIWVLKMTNKIMSLSYKNSMAELEELGTDPGSNDVNMQYFTQFGVAERHKKDDLEKIMEDQNKRETKSQTEAPAAFFPQPETSDFGGDNFLGNIQWFDQWLDFDQNL